MTLQSERRQFLELDNATLREEVFRLECENAELRDARPPFWMLPVLVAGGICYGGLLGWLLIQLIAAGVSLF